MLERLRAGARFARRVARVFHEQPVFQRRRFSRRGQRLRLASRLNMVIIWRMALGHIVRVKVLLNA